MLFKFKYKKKKEKYIETTLYELWHGTSSFDRIYVSTFYVSKLLRPKSLQKYIHVCFNHLTNERRGREHKEKLVEVQCHSNKPHGTSM